MDMVETSSCCTRFFATSSSMGAYTSICKWVCLFWRSPENHCALLVVHDKHQKGVGVPTKTPTPTKSPPTAPPTPPPTPPPTASIPTTAPYLGHFFRMCRHQTPGRKKAKPTPRAPTSEPKKFRRAFAASRRWSRSSTPARHRSRVLAIRRGLSSTKIDYRGKLVPTHSNLSAGGPITICVTLYGLRAGASGQQNQCKFMALELVSKPDTGKVALRASAQCVHTCRILGSSCYCIALRVFALLSRPVRD